MNTRRKRTATGIPQPVEGPVEEQLVEAVNWIMKTKSINLTTRVARILGKNHVRVCHSVQALLLKVNAYEERIQDYNYCQ